MKHRIVALAVMLGMSCSTALWADELTTTVAAHQSALDMIWLLVAASLVFFMQAGFAMVEVGLTRPRMPETSS